MRLLILSRVICGNLVITNHNLVQNVVQTCQFVLTIEYNQPTQNTFPKIALSLHLSYFLELQRCSTTYATGIYLLRCLTVLETGRSELRTPE